MYERIITDHFRNPRNVGEMREADGVGRMGMPDVGDMLTFYIRVRDDRIEHATFTTLACGASTALSSIISDMVIGRKLEEAMNISATGVMKALGGRPLGKKIHCLNLCSDALHLAIEDCRSKRAGTDDGRPAVTPEACDYPMCGLNDPTQCVGLLGRGVSA